MKGFRFRHTGVGESIARLVSKADKLPMEELKDRLVGLSHESQVLEGAYECLSMGILITDTNGILRFANKASRRLLSISPSAGDEERLADTPVWEYVGSADVSSFLRETFCTGGGNKSDEFSVVSSSGNVHFLSVAIQTLALDDEGGGEWQAVITVQDVTEQKKAQIKAHRMESLAELTNLAASMAHEIKNPLGAISIHVQLIQKALAKARAQGDTLPGEKFLEQPLDVVSEEVSSLNSIVMQFLLAVRPIKAQLEILDAVQIIKETTAFVSPEFEKHGFTATAQADSSPIRLLIDGRLMKEVVVNMAQNSLAALITRYEDESGAGEAGNSGRGGRFEISVKKECDECIIKLCDNGKGMTQEVASRIFEPYFTTKADGTGLGMTMVYKIIKEFNGSIEVASSEDGGTVFTIRLPLPQTGKRRAIEFRGTANAAGDRG